MKKLLQLAFLFLLCAVPVLAQKTYYIDYSAGSDANTAAQAQSKLTPWRTAPGMANASGHSGYSCAAGDRYILKGGVTFDYHIWPWNLPCAGISSTQSVGCAGSGCTYYGVDVTWFNGGAFTRPILSGGDWSDPGTNTTCFYDTNGHGGIFVIYGATSFVILDNLEFTGMCNSTGKSGANSVTYLSSSGSTHNTVTNSYFHRMTFPAVLIQSAGDYGRVGNVGSLSNYSFNVFDFTDNGPTTTYTIAAGGSGFYSGGGPVGPYLDHNVFVNMSQALSEGGHYTSIHDNYFLNASGQSVQTGSNGIHPHISNDTGCVSNGGYVVWYNNVIDTVGFGQGFQPNGNSGSTTGCVYYIFNDVWTNNVGDGRIWNFATTGAPFSGWTMHVWNDTIELGSDAGSQASIMRWGVATFTAYNFHFIGSAASPITAGTNLPGPDAPMVSWTSSTGVTAPATFATIPGNPGDIIQQTKAAANAQGYSYGQAIQFSPTTPSGITVGAGVNRTAFCGTIPDAGAAAACLKDTTYGVTYNQTNHTAVCCGRTPNNRPSVGAWDAGAYQFGAAPVVNLTPSPVAFGSQIDGTTSAPITVTVTNNGTATETLSSPYFSITGTNGADFANAGTGTCANGGTIAVSASCTINLTFTPSAPGSRSAIITVLGTALGAASMTGTGVAVSPAVTLVPTSIAFGSQTTGTSSGAQVITLTNSGTASMTITSIALTGTNASEFSLNSSTCGASLAVSASCHLNVVFSPLTAASKTANVTFTTNTSTSPDNVALTGTGVAPAVPSLSIAPSPVAFGNQITGSTSSALTVTITNSGSGAQVFATPFFVISGTNAADFARSGGTCADGGTLNSGSCTILLTFTPGANGARSGTLTINGTASIVDSLTGTGIAPAVSLNPTSIAFGNQTSGTSSGNSAVTLTNSGTGPLTITSITLTGANSTEFSTNSSTCGSTLAAAASCSLNVVFSPTSVASKNASLTFTTNASTSPDNVSLTGTGIAPTIPVLSFSPNPVTFGNQTVATTSSGTTVTVSNVGTASETLATPFYAFTGTNASNFARSGGTCTNGGSIAVSGSCTIVVTFTPSATGSRVGSLVISGTTIASDSLSGTGVAATNPAVSLSPGSINFGNQNDGTTSANVVVTLTNTGTAVLNISGITVTGTNVTEFSTNTVSLPNPCGLTLAVSASCTINAAFSPATTGAKSASLTFTTNASTSPDAVTMTGTGLTPSPNPTPAPAVTIVSILPPGSVVLTSGSFAVSPRYAQVTAQGCTIDGNTFQNPCRFTFSCGNCSSTTAVRWNGTVVSQKYQRGTITASVPLSLIPIPTVSTDYSLSLSN